jgi:hypothetical protein
VEKFNARKLNYEP